MLFCFRQIYNNIGKVCCQRIIVMHSLCEWSHLKHAVLVSNLSLCTWHYSLPATDTSTKKYSFFHIYFHVAYVLWKMHSTFDFFFQTYHCHLACTLNRWQNICSRFLYAKGHTRSVFVNGKNYRLPPIHTVLTRIDRRLELSRLGRRR